VQRITLNLSATFIVPDHEEVLSERFLEFDRLVGDFMFGHGAETVIHHPSQSEPVSEGVCRHGGHPFVSPPRWRLERPLPDICPDHARQEEDAAAEAEHATLFAEIRRLTGLEPIIWPSGGSTKSILIPLHAPSDGRWSPPLYLGLKDGDDSDTDNPQGHWYGSVSYYSTDQAYLDGEPDEDVVDSHTGTPQDWARAIAEHHAWITNQTADTTELPAAHPEHTPTANGPAAPPAAGMLLISLRIENTYARYDDEVTVVTDEVIPAPPAGADQAAWDDWAYTHIFQLTGAGHTDGDAWYDVTVTACSDPALIGRQFHWGY
jgi:hypothetical protein